MFVRTTVLVVTTVLLAAACGSDSKEPTVESTRPEGSASGADIAIDDVGRLIPADCDSSENVANEAEGVTEDTVNVVAANVDLGAVAKLGFAASGRDMSAMPSVFIDEINENGGICGRTIDLQQVLYDPLAGAGAMGESCIEATQDRANLVAFTVAYQDPLCITDTGLPMVVHSEATEDEMAKSGDLLLSRKPSVDDQYRATAQYAIDSGAADGKVGLWYGDVRPELGDVVEEVVFPMLDDAGVDYTPMRTDFTGPNEPEGNVVLTAAAAQFASDGVDTVIAIVSNLNLTMMQLELHAQGIDPRYISAPISGNTANELFTDALGATEVADGTEYVTFTFGINEIVPDDLISKDCNEIWTRRTGETLSPDTFDHQLVATVCVMVDEIAAALSAAGGDLTRESFMAALESLPRHLGPPLFAEIVWSIDQRFGPAVFSVLDYDGSTNRSTARSELFEIDR